MSIALTEELYMRLTIISILLAGVSSLSAQITWQTTESVQTADLFAKDLLYTFYGKNTGTQPIKINSLRASCPCLVASSDKMELAPNDEILVVGEFDPFEIGGTQRQRIMVAIEGQEQPDVLTVIADLPETITISEKRLFWKSSGEAESQTVTLALSEKEDVELIDVYAMDENFSTNLKEVSANKYVLTVTPEDLKVLRPAAVMVRYKVNGRPIRTTIPCVIGKKNPFKISYRPKIKQLTGAEIEASIRTQEPLHIPEGISNPKLTPPASLETQSQL